MAKNILEIKNLTFSFHTYGGVVKPSGMLVLMYAKARFLEL